MKTSAAIELHFWHASQVGCNVPEIKPQEKKAILADPVGIFCQQYPDTSDQQAKALQSLAQQYDTLDKQHRDTKKQTQNLSRLIGNARKNGESIDELMTSMQTQSRQLKTLSAELAGTGNRILDYFVCANDLEKAAAGKDSNRGREYSATDCPVFSIAMNEDADDDWNHYAASSPAASIYHRIEWKELIRKTFGHSGYYFSARNNNGDIVGILPTIRLKSRLFGDFMTSMPYFNYGGAIADHPQIELHLMQAAAAHAENLGVSHIEYRDSIAHDGYPSRTEKVNMILPLPDNEDSLWQMFTPKLRAQIKRPQRENSQAMHNRADSLSDFYAVFTRNMRDLGTPVYPISFFKNILDEFPDACHIQVIRLNNRPVAAAFLIGHGETLEIPWASTLRDVNHLSMNMLLYWEVLKYAIKQGYKQFDFGRSSKDSGTYRFKQQWGAQAKQSYWHYWLKAGSSLPALNPDNPKYALAIKSWRKLPLSMTIWLGPLIVKNLP